MTIRPHFRVLLSSGAWLPALALSVLGASGAPAQTINLSESFTGTSTTNTWYAINGACMTAGTAATSGTATATTAGSPPACVSDSYYSETLVGGWNGVSGSGATLPDTVGYGALRFTNGCINGSSCSSSGGHNQNGAIISGLAYSSSAGVQVTFKTTTYRGDSDNGDGADGMSFFLIDGSVTPNIGSYGGSLGYTCSNSNSDYHGMIGGYIGLGIDEFGNFLNPGDNTASGPNQTKNRIGMRGAGSINWAWLLANYGTYYNTTTYTGSTSNQNNAVKNTCKNGYLSDYNGNSITGSTKTTVLDYPAIPNALKVLTGVTIANEYATKGYSRQVAVPIMYNLTITPAGLLTFSYSVNGGSWQGVLSNQSITASNGALPATIRFGFAGSTGGGSNIHEVLCFKAASLDTSGSSASSNLQQSAKITSSTQAYFAYYNPNDWTGRLTANTLSTDTSGNLLIATTANWDASCVLTGGPCTATNSTTNTAAEGPTSRVIMTWNGTTGVPFEWTNLTTAQQNAIDLGDSSLTANRVAYLRGDRTNEMTTSGTGLYRVRDGVLGDIVNSSPVAVGQPVYPYSITWKDKLVSTDTTPENSGQSYSAFFTAEQTRQTMVYAGANDGLLHGFRSGSYDTSNNFVSTTNDGYELIAYMPGSIIQSAATAGNVVTAASTTTTSPSLSPVLTTPTPSVSQNCATTTATQTFVQNIHGETPVINSTAACVDTTLDYSNPQYGHNFFVDAPPGTGDLFYNGVWHTWLVGGLGAGGAAIYALDVTNPSNFSETNASSIVIGEWSQANLTCSNSSTCANSLGNTYGTPVIRRLHNGTWAVIFGNGLNSTTGDAGIYVMTINQSTGAQTFYYLSTGTGSGTTASPCTSGCNGISYVTPVDLDGDHITDYVYAGDVLGNVWRFDLTSGTTSSWTAGSAPIFAAGSAHPITSALLVAAVSGAEGTQIMVALGSGQQNSVTNAAPTTYASGSQYLYAFWDWNYTAWNTASTVQYASLNSSATGFHTLTGLSSPYTMAPSNLTAQTLAVNTTSSTVDVTSSTICWVNTSTCSGGTSANKSFGWDAALPSTQEQIVYNPELVGNAFVVNSLIPAVQTVASCTTSLNTGYTYAFNLGTGSVSTSTTTTTTTTTTGTTTTTVNTNNFFVTSGDNSAVGVLTNAVGTAFLVQTIVATGQSSGTLNNAGAPITCTGTNCPTQYSNPFSAVAGCSIYQTYLMYQTTTGTGGSKRVAPACPLTGQRVSWSQKR